MMLFCLFSAVILLNANLVISKEDLSAREFINNRNIEVNELFKLLSNEILLSKDEQLSKLVKYVFFNGQADIMAECETRLAETRDTKEKLKLINDATGTTLFTISGNNVSFEAEALQYLILPAVKTFFERQCPDENKRLTAIDSVKQQMKINIAEARRFLKPVSLDVIESALSSQSLIRSKRNVNNVITTVFKSFVQLMVNRIKSIIDTFLGNVTTTVSNLYIGVQQTNIILATVTKFSNQAILELTQLLVNFQEWIDTLLGNVLSQFSRRKREIPASDMYLEFQSPYEEPSNNRIKRSLLTSIETIFESILKLFNPIVIFLNSTVKNVFVTFLKARYAALGYLVLYPIRLLFEIIVDTVLPCSSCGSIV